MKNLWKAFKTVVATVTVIAVVFSAGYFVGKFSSAEAEVVNHAEDGFNLQLPGETEKMVVTIDEVESKILEIGELTSCESTYVVTKGQDFTRYMLDNIPVPGTTNHIELTCTGIVKAGYNLKDIVIKVDTDSQTIYVSLPDAQISSNHLIWDDSMECNEKNNILNPIDFEQYKPLIADIQTEGLQDAVNNGLYDAVEQNAKNLITNFLGCFVGYKVVFM